MSGAARSRGGCGSPTLPAPGRALRPRLRRLAAGRRVPPPRGGGDPSSPKRQRESLRPRPPPRRRRRGALPLLHQPLAAAQAASPSPTATATRTAPRRPGRRCSTMSAVCSRRPRRRGGRCGRGGDRRDRGLAEVVHPASEAPSEDELARSVAARGAGRRAATLLAAGRGGDDVSADRGAARGRPGGRGGLAGPRADRNPAVIESLGSRRRLRRHHAGGLRPLLLPLVRRATSSTHGRSTRCPTRSSRAA